MDLAEYKKLRNTTPIQSAVINVTDQCNLRCPYCFTAHNKRVISLDTMKSAINFVLKDCSRFENPKQYSPTFTFFGGEPMLYYNQIIKPTLEWANKKRLCEKFGVHFSITSNGTLFDEENLKFLSENKVDILLSIDGDKETQDDQRPGANGGSSFDMINIPLILQYYPDVTFRSTVEPRNANKIARNYAFARNSGFRKYFITPNLSAKWSPTDIGMALRQLAIIAEIIYSDIEKGYSPLIWSDFFNTIESHLIKQNRSEELSCIRCGLGTTSIGVAVNGDIYGCQEHNTYQEEKDDPFLIGNIYSGLDPAKHCNLLNLYLSREHMVCFEDETRCENCLHYVACTNKNCPSHNFAAHNLWTVPKTYCQWQDFIEHLVLEWLSRIVDEDNQVIIQFLHNFYGI